MTIKHPLFEDLVARGVLVAAGEDWLGREPRDGEHMALGKLALLDRQLRAACGGDAVSLRVARAIGEALIALHRLRGDAWAMTLTPGKLSIIVGTKPVLEAVGPQVRFFAPAGSTSDFKRMRVAFKTTRLSGSGLFGVEIISVAAPDFPRVFEHVSAALLAAAGKAVQSGPVGTDVHQREALWTMRRLTQMDLPDPSEPKPPSRKPRSASRVKPAPMRTPAPRSSRSLASRAAAEPPVSASAPTPETEGLFFESDRVKVGTQYRVLSVRPPWAWSIIFAGKDVENRSWVTPYRGTILIHASSKKFTGKALEDARAEIARSSGIELAKVPKEFPRSQMLGFVDVVDCVANSRSAWAFPGEQHWLLRRPQPLANAVLGVDGKLNLWRWTHTA